MIDHERQDLPKLIRGLSQPLEPRPTATPAQVRPLSGIKAVLFDVYGTLLISGTGDIGAHSESLPEAALQEALANSGFAPAPGGNSLAPAARRGGALLVSSIEAAHARRRSEGVDFPEVEIREIWRAVLATLSEEDLIDDAGGSDSRLERFAIEYECRVNPVWPMPGTLSVLHDLKSHGLDLGIISNAQFYTPITLGALCGESLVDLGFNPGFCSWSFAQLAAKPSVSIYESVLDPLWRLAGIRPSETLYVGNDMLKDVWAAAQAGCRTALFAGDERSLRLRKDDPRTRHLRPDLVLTELVQLLACLEPDEPR